MTTSWHLRTFEELTSLELYEILKLRSEVFVVEQACAYLDIDGYDIHHCHHLFQKTDLVITAYTRLLAPGTSYKDQSSIGRVVTSPAYRKKGQGKELMRRSISQILELYPDHDIKIGAQCYLLNFYESFGFEKIGKDYLEDGILHTHMIYKNQSI